MQRSSAFLILVFLGISHYTIFAITNLDVGLLVAVSSNETECDLEANNDMSYPVIVLEAYRYGIEKANQELQEIGINLKPRVLPYCNQDVLLYKRIINVTLDQQRDMCIPDLKPPDNLIAIIASTPSNLSTIVTANLQEICVPLIASVATDPNLDKFPNFKRTMPNDEYQAQLLWEVLKFMNATPALILYDSSGYASRLLSKLRDFSNSNENDFCIEEEILVATEIDREYEHIMGRLNNSQAVAVVLLTTFNGAKYFFTYLQDNAPKLSEKFQYFGPDAWCGKYSRSKVPIPNSTIGVMPYLGEDDKFREYLNSITLEKACKENKTELAQVIAEQQMCKGPCGSSSICNKSATLILNGDAVGAMFRAKFFIESIMQLKDAIQLMLHFCNPASNCSEIWAQFSGHKLVDYMKQSKPNTTYGLFTFSEDQEKWQYIDSYDVSLFNKLDMSEDVISQLPTVNSSQLCIKECPQKNMKQSGKCCLVCEPCNVTSRVENNQCIACAEGEVDDFNGSGLCVEPKTHKIDIARVSFVVLYVLTIAGIVLLSMIAVVILLKVTGEMQRLLCSEANAWYIIGALIHFVSCITCTVPLSHRVCYVIWISSSFGSTVASAANLMHLIAYSYAPRQGDNRFYLPLLLRSCSPSQIRRHGVMFCLIFAQVVITVIVVATVKNGSKSLPFDKETVPPDYVTICEWSIEIMSVLLVIPICTIVLVLILAMQMTGIVISIVRRQVKNIWVASMITLLTDVLLLPINSGAYDVSKNKRIAFFVVYNLVQGYILILFLLVPFVYTVLWKQSRFNSATAKVAVPTVRRT